MYGAFVRSAYPPRLLLLAFSLLSSLLAALLAVTCFVLALNKRSDPNGAVSLPGGQQFATFFTAGIFLAVLPIPLIMFLSTLGRNWQRGRRHSPSSSGSGFKVYEPAALEGLSLPPTRPFFFISWKTCRIILAVAIVVQIADAVAFTTIVCIRQNTDICLFNGRAVLCNLLTATQKLAIVIPGFFQILAQIVLLGLIEPYARSFVGHRASASANTEAFAPINTSLTGGKGSFQLVPGSNPDVDKDGDLTNYVYDQLYDPVYDDTAKELRLDDYYSYNNLHHVPALSSTGKSTRSNTFKGGSHMQGPRPAPKLKSGSVVQYAPPATPAPAVAPPRKGKGWFKRFKSKAIETIPDGDEDAGEAEVLVKGSGRIPNQSSDKSRVFQERDRHGDVDGEDEGAL